ncbi:hypothetical protein [Paenibacillus sp. TY11]|uniref:hypothetical protein n=1 Tax=Paenibacillus sp. TY11 TaxID=3448633 RepID=UPI00403A47E1
MSEKNAMSECVAPISGFLHIVSGKWAFSVMAELMLGKWLLRHGLEEDQRRMGNYPS